LRFLRQAFAQKRKTLNNNLRAAGVAPADAAAALASAGIAAQARAEAVPVEGLAALWRALGGSAGLESRTEETAITKS
jgi:16S rRNA (adenine1518-N6/adenine1519-N6)-dimethyltransferase